MNSSVTKAGTSWSSLSEFEKEYGIHPNRLNGLNFDIEWSEILNDSKKIYQFFLSCRLAASDSEFRKGIDNIKGLYTSRTLKDHKISNIAFDALFTELPTEKRIKVGDVSFEDEGWGDEYVKYKRKFVEIYNHHIDEQTSYLMHPLRKKELVKCLVKQTSFDQDLLAERLIEFRCFGKNWLDNFESYNERKRCENKLKQIKSQIKQLDAEGVKIINDYSLLREGDFLFIDIKFCRKYVLLTYKFLASQNLLEILQLPEKVLYYHSGVNTEAHEALVDIVKLYDKEAPVGAFHFGVVIKFLKQLKNNDLNELHRYCLLEEENRISWYLKHDKSFGQSFDRVLEENRILDSGKYDSLLKLETNPQLNNIGVLKKVKVLKYQLLSSRL